MRRYDLTTQTIADNIAKNIEDKNTFTASKMLVEVRRVQGAVSGLAQMGRSKKPTETEAAHYHRVAGAAKKVDEVVAAISERMPVLQAERAQDIEDRIEERLGLVENQYASEVRATIRNMEGKQRNDAVLQIIKAGDGASIAAIIKSPPIISGLDTETQNRYYEWLVDKKAPDLAAERDVLTQAVSDIATLMGEARSASAAFSDPEKVRLIEQGEEKAAKAEAQFNEAVA